MDKSFLELLQDARNNPGTPNLGTTLTIHHRDSTVYFGYGSLRYYRDIPSQLAGGSFPAFPQIGNLPIQRVPMEGFTSRQSTNFKAVSSRDQSFIVRGSWGEPQPFIVAGAHPISLSVYIPPKAPFIPYNPNVIVIEIENGGLSLRLDAEQIDNMLRAFGPGLEPDSGNAVYVLTFDDVLAGDLN